MTTKTDYEMTEGDISFYIQYRNIQTNVAILIPHGDNEENDENENYVQII